MNIDKPQCNLKTCRYCHDHNCFWDYERCEYTLAKRPHGEWIFDKDYPMLGSPYGSYKCSECGMHTDDDVDNYCWFCGADMQANDRQMTGKLNSEIEKLNSEIEKLNSEIVPDYRDGWRKRGGAE